MFFCVGVSMDQTDDSIGGMVMVDRPIASHPGPPPQQTHTINTHRAASGVEGAKKVDRAPWKWAVRQRIWELLEKRDLAAPPRPVYHRMYVCMYV